MKGVRFPKLTGPSNSEVTDAVVVIKARNDAVAQREARARVQCANFGVSRFSPIAAPCGKWFPITEAVFVDTQHWVSAYGCTGGAYWRSGEGSFVCPHCGFLNRCFQREEIASLRRHFARVVVAYEPDSCFSNRLRFEDNQSYPFPAKVKAQLELNAAEAELNKARSRVKTLERAVRR